MGQWKRSKEAWEERMRTFCNSGAMESEKQFILECNAFKDIADIYGNMLALVPWHCLFCKGTVRMLGHLIINLNKKRTELQKAKNREVGVP